MPLLPFVLPAKSRALQTWPCHDWLPVSTLPPRGFGRLRASFHDSAASVVGPAGSLVLDSSTVSVASLATSSIMRSPADLEHSTTEEEWYGVGRVLTGLRMHSLKSSPAAAARYAKQTTDTDVWAWKETADWDNRRAIRSYLRRGGGVHTGAGWGETGGEGESRRRPNSAPRKQRKAMPAVRPHTASRIRRPPVVVTATADAEAEAAAGGDGGSGHGGVNGDCVDTISGHAEVGDESAHMLAAVHSSGADWVYSLASGKGGRGGKTVAPRSGLQLQLQQRQPPRQQQRRRQQKTQAATPSSRPRYRISRKRKESFATVTVRDKLVLEKVTRKLQTKRYCRKQAAESFRLQHQSGGGGKLW